MLIISNKEAEQLLDMKSCLEELEAIYHDALDNGAVHRPRIDMYVPCGRPDGYYRWGSMEGASRASGIFAIRMKSDIVHWPDGKTEEKYCVQPGTFCGLILLFSTVNGEPLAILNDGIIQHLRVGACAGLGVKYLARRDASRVGMIGSGGMARSFLTAFCAVRKIRQVKVYSPTEANRKAYAAEMEAKLGVEVIPVASAAEAAREVDIMASCTDSLSPVLRTEWALPGMHFTNVAGHEYSEQFLDLCDVVINLGQGTFPIPEGNSELKSMVGGIASYVAGTEEEIARIPRPPRKNLLGAGSSFLELLEGKASGRTSESQITFFKNVGTQGLQFAAVAGHAYRLAREKGLGREIPTDWFLQNIRD